MPIERVRDIMRRTVTNLEFIEQNAGRNGPFEVTQLINSFLGALAHPWEHLKGDLNRMALEQAHQLGWPEIRRERASEVEPQSLGHLVKLMRNSLAHGGIEFLPAANGEIQALRIWNEDRSKRRTWGAIITVKDARAFLLGFVALADDLYASSHRNRGRG